MKFKKSEIAPIAQRIINAENKFIDSVVEQFGKTEDEAKIILEVFKREKIVKIDPIGGRFTLTDGIYWDGVVMNNVLSMRGESK